MGKPLPRISEKRLRHVFRGLHFALATLARPRSPLEYAPYTGQCKQPTGKPGAMAMGPGLLYTLGAGNKRLISGKAGTRARRPRKG